MMVNKIKNGFFVFVIISLVVFVLVSSLYFRFPYKSEIVCISYSGLTDQEILSSESVCRSDDDFDDLYDLLISSIEDDIAPGEREQLMFIADVDIDTVYGCSLNYRYNGWFSDGVIRAVEVESPMKVRRVNDNFVRVIDLISRRIDINVLY